MTQDRITARTSTIDIRKSHVQTLLSEALKASDHFLAFDLINAARLVWGKQYDPEFDDMAGSALIRARQLNQAFIDGIEDPS